MYLPVTSLHAADTRVVKCRRDISGCCCMHTPGTLITRSRVSMRFGQQKTLQRRSGTCWFPHRQRRTRGGSASVHDAIPRAIAAAAAAYKTRGQRYFVPGFRCSSHQKKISRIIRTCLLPRPPAMDTRVGTQSVTCIMWSYDEPHRDSGRWLFDQIIPGTWP